MPLRIGRIAYLNVVPYFHCLGSTGFAGEIVSGVPAELNRMLAEGMIDACPSSSFEYGLHAEDYLLLPGHSISSIGRVHSVLLFCYGPLANLNNGQIALTGESATSINLLKILLHEFCGIEKVVCEVPEMTVEKALDQGMNALLIGDRALKAAKQHAGSAQIIDLGALWYHFTGLPFVFALWILRKESVVKNHLAFLDLYRQLSESRNRAFAQLDEIAKQLENSSVLDAKEMVRYWRGMSYELTDGHQEGLRLYFTLCKKYGLLGDVPEPEFLSTDRSNFQRAAR